MASTDGFNFDTIDAPVVSGFENAEAANAASEAALASASGDAPEVPDVPDGYVDLPIGINIDGETITSAEVRELTGADEEALARVRSRQRAYIDRVLELGTVRLGSRPATHDALRKLYIGDRDALLIAIRRAMFGDQMDFEGVRCATCKTRIDLTIDLTQIPMRATPENLRPTIELRKMSAVVRFPAGDDQAELIDRSDKDGTTTAELNTLLLNRVVEEFIKPDGSRVVANPISIRDLGVADRITLLKYVGDNVPGPLMNEITVTHEDCGQEVAIPVNVGDLFREL
ncbi:hypothetical protein [Streptomyces sp. NBC_00470]|uniref:T4 family baseplate hub assembly chaperone n=1 Tax=Streptomyces sp. NBC_00470 TaxID=2975753 RepID=UPI0030E37B03